MNDNTKITGIWWLSSDPKNQVAGDLMIDDRKLELNGSFEGIRSGAIGGSPRIVSVFQNKTIQGVARKGGKQYTLEYFEEPSYSLSMPGYKADTYRLGNIFEGGHFQRTDSLSFERYYAEFPYLFEWAGASVIKSQMQILDDKHFGSTTITVNNPVTLEIFKNKDFELSFVVTPSGIKIGPMVKEMKLGQECSLKIESTKNGLSLQEAGSIINHFERFLTIAVGKSLELSKYQASSAKGKDSRTVNLYLHSWRRKDYKNIDRHNMNFTFGDIKDDCQTIFETWFADRGKYVDVFDLFSSIRLDTGKNLNNQFKDVASAIEGYYGIKKNNTSPNKLDEAIKYFNEQLPINNQPLSNDMRNKIRITRNKLSHINIKPEEEKNVLDNEGKWFAFQKMLVLLEYSLLKNLGLSETMLANFYKKRKTWG